MDANYEHFPLRDYPSLKNSINAAKKGGYKFHYGAPVFIVTAN